MIVVRVLSLASIEIAAVCLPVAVSTDAGGESGAPFINNLDTNPGCDTVFAGSGARSSMVGLSGWLRFGRETAQGEVRQP